MHPLSVQSNDLFKIAGDAAAILEEMGFVAVARKKNNTITIEFWRGKHSMRYDLPDVAVSPRALASACAAEFQARVGED